MLKRVALCSEASFAHQFVNCPNVDASVAFNKLGQVRSYLFYNIHFLGFLYGIDKRVSLTDKLVTGANKAGDRFVQLADPPIVIDNIGCGFCDASTFGVWYAAFGPISEEFQVWLGDYGSPPSRFLMPFFLLPFEAVR